MSKAIKVSGKGGFNNDGKPINLQIYGTSTTSQNLTIGGNGAISAVVYAPLASFTSNGGGSSGSTSGSIVAKNVTFNGSPGPFHFDESLRNLTMDGDFDVNKFVFLEPNTSITANGKTQSIIQFITDTVINGRD